MLKQRSNTLVVLEIGSSKIVCLVCKVLKDDLQVIGIGHNKSSGIKAGVITDLKTAVSGIVQAIETAEYAAGERITRVYVAISPSNLISRRNSSDLSVMGHEINSKDIHKLLINAVERYSNQDLEILHSFVYDYILDGNRGITTPLGMYGNKLGAELHIVAAPSVTIMNVTNCLAKCQLEPQGYVSSSYASGIACLTQDEMRLGVTLIEFGAGCTSISIFYNSQMVFTDGVPIGGGHITNDIAKGLCINMTTAERVKNLYGTVILTTDNNKDIMEITDEEDGETESILINKALLVEIIRSRVEEIVELLKAKLEENKFDVHNNKIVITGGGAKLNGIKELLSYMFVTKVRLGQPQFIEGLPEQNTGTEFSTAIGMALYGAQQWANSKNTFNKSESSFGLLRWLKELWGQNA